MDHHGIVAGICKELKIAERINEQLKVHDKRIVSPGQAVVSMINELGFTSRRLYLSHQFFINKLIELLLESGLKAGDITDYTLGHALDEIYEYGSSEFIYYNWFWHSFRA